MAQVQLVQQHEVAALFQAEAHRDHRVAHHVSRLVQPQQHFAVARAGREAPGEVIIRVRRGRPAVGPRPTPARPATAPCPVWSPPRYRPPRSWSSSRRCRRPWHRVPPGAPWRHRG
ncbi:hypothetical protein G6F31_018732 [Rhizopus arrhizus]|nr:hypothetical protein G6F31_018732 [Rhizopus arrhizus]